jgi:hypothetical protein
VEVQRGWWVAKAGDPVDTKVPRRRGRDAAGVADWRTRRRECKRSGSTSQTWEGCRRGRSGVRPLRQPVGITLLKNSQKMNPEHFGWKGGTLWRRSRPARDHSDASAFDQSDQRSLDG